MLKLLAYSSLIATLPYFNLKFCQKSKTFSEIIRTENVTRKEYEF